MESNDSIGICCFLLFLVVYILFTLIKNGTLEICFLKVPFCQQFEVVETLLYFFIKIIYNIADKFMVVRQCLNVVLILEEPI